MDTARTGDGRTPRGSVADALIPWLLLLGGFLLGIGWFVGIGLLWTSNTWRLRDKLLGTFVLPGGLVPLALVSVLPGSVMTCTGGTVNGRSLPQTCVTTGFAPPPAVGAAMFLCLLFAPILTAVHLERVRRSAGRDAGDGVRHPPVGADRADRAQGGATGQRQG